MLTSRSKSVCREAFRSLTQSGDPVVLRMARSRASSIVHMAASPTVFGGTRGRIFARQVSSSDEEDEDGDARWIEHSALTRYKMGMPPEAQPWTPFHDLRGVPKSSRVHDTLQVAYWAWRQNQNTGSPDGNKFEAPKWFCDCSQGVQRIPWGPTPNSFN